MSYDVITLGSGTIDVFAYTEANYIKDKNGKNSRELLTYPTGSKILINELRFEIGGGGTNTATTFSRLGLKTAWLGKLGFDHVSEKILRFLKSEKIDFLGTISKGMSGYSVILDSKGHDRTILAHKGENDNLKFNEINLSKLKTKWFYFSSMMGKSFIAQKKLSNYAAKNNIKLAFNPSSYQAELGKDVLKPILKNTTALIFNLEEAKLLLNTKESKIEKIMLELVKLGPKYVIITDGKKGAHCYHEGILYKSHSRDEKILETTGAGDAFASSFIAGIILTKNDIKKSLKMAQSNAESVISHYGAKNNLLNFNKLKSRMKLKPNKVSIKIIKK